MKLTDFTKTLMDNNLGVMATNYSIAIYVDGNTANLALVIPLGCTSTSDVKINTYLSSLSFNQIDWLFNQVKQYVNTPLDQRENTYWIQVSKNGNNEYLVKKGDGSWGLSAEKTNDNLFTQTQVDSFKQQNLLNLDWDTCLVLNS